MEYISPVRMAWVKKYLNDIRLSNSPAEGLDKFSAFSKIYKIITKLSRKWPRSHRGDDHKVDSSAARSWGLGGHMSGWAEWQNKLTFQELYGELWAALKLQKEAKNGIQRGAATKTS